MDTRYGSEIFYLPLPSHLQLPISYLYILGVILTTFQYFDIFLSLNLLTHIQLLHLKFLIDPEMLPPPDTVPCEGAFNAPHVPAGTG